MQACGIILSVMLEQAMPEMDQRLGGMQQSFHSDIDAVHQTIKHQHTVVINMLINILTTPMTVSWPVASALVSSSKLSLTVQPASALFSQLLLRL